MVVLLIPVILVAAFIAWVVLGNIGTFFYDLGWWPIGAFFRIDAWLALIGGIIASVSIVIGAIGNRLRSS